MESQDGVTRWDHKMESKDESKDESQDGVTRWSHKMESQWHMIEDHLPLFHGFFDLLLPELDHVGCF